MQSQNKYLNLDMCYEIIKACVCHTKYILIACLSKNLFE